MTTLPAWARVALAITVCGVAAHSHGFNHDSCGRSTDLVERALLHFPVFLALMAYVWFRKGRTR
jgi:hypothetical protein